MSADHVLTGGMLIDGTGTEPFLADIALEGGKIVKIGAPGSIVGQTLTDVSGSFISPGFVDIHSHADYTVLQDGRAHSSVLQGVTSLVVGNCGHGVAPLSAMSAEMASMNIFGWVKDTAISATWRSFDEYIQLLRERGVGPNVFPLVPHGTLRMSVAGFSERPLDNAEISSLRSALEEAMSAGAVGMSTGLEYAPGLSASRDELTSIAEGMKDYGGLYATHCRNRSDAMDEAASEAIAIAKAGKARLQMSHFVKRPHGTTTMANRSWELLEDAKRDGMKVFADVFPFSYGPTPLSALIPARLRAASKGEMVARLRDAEFKKSVLAGMGLMFEAAVKNDLVRSMYVAADGADGSFVGLSLAEVAERIKITPVEAAYWLLQNAGEDFGSATIVENWALWNDLTAALEDHRYYVMGDGATSTLDRSRLTMALSDWGYAPKFIAEFVRDSGKIRLADAIHRMTLGPARQVGLHDRGSIAVGQAADLVAFRLDAIGTSVAPNDLSRAPTGIDHVWVNGTKVVDGGVPTNSLPGVVGLAR